MILDSIGKDIEKPCQSVYPFHDVFVREGKVPKKPKFELQTLMEVHGEDSCLKMMRQGLKLNK